MKSHIKAMGARINEMFTVKVKLVFSDYGMLIACRANIVPNKKWCHGTDFRNKKKTSHKF